MRLTRRPLRRLRRAVAALRRRFERRWHVDPARVRSALDIPEQLSPKTAVVVSKAHRDQWLVFDCPCQTQHRVMLNLDPGRRPVWTITRDDKLSLTPSVDQRTAAQRCHYIFKKGRVTWV